MCSRPARRGVRAGAALLALACLAGCAAPGPQVVSGRYVWAEGGLVFDLPGGGWTVSREEGGRAVLFTPAGLPGHMVVRWSPQDGGRPAAGPVMARALLVHFERKSILASTRDRVMGRAAHGLVAAAWVDGRPIRLRTCSLATGGRVHDFACWSSPETFGRVSPLFDEWLRGIGRLETGAGDPAPRPPAERSAGP